MTRLSLLLVAASAITARADIGYMGCRPLDEATVTETNAGLSATTDTPTSGVLQQDDLVVRWAWRDSWDTGTCIDFEISNRGAPLTSWAIDVVLDQPVTTFVDESSNAFVAGEVITITQGADATLGSFERVTSWACVEPYVVPVGLFAFGQRGDDPRYTDPEVMHGPRNLDAILDPNGQLLVMWSQDGYSTTEEICYDVQVANCTPYVMSEWRAQLGVNDELDLAAAEYGMYFAQLSDMHLQAAPTEHNYALPPFGNAEGRICLHEPVDLLTVASTYDLSEAPEPPSPFDHHDDHDHDHDDDDPDDDHVAPVVSAVEGIRLDADTLRIAFNTNEASTSMVCDSGLRCVYSRTTGNSHVVELEYTGDWYTIHATDLAGNTTEVGPFQF